MYQLLHSPGAQWFNNGIPKRVLNGTTKTSDVMGWMGACFRLHEKEGSSDLNVGSKQSPPTPVTC